MPREAHVGKGTKFEDNIDDLIGTTRKIVVLSIDNDNKHVTAKYTDGGTDSFLIVYITKDGKKTTIRLNDKENKSRYIIRIKVHKGKPEKDQCSIVSFKKDSEDKGVVIVPTDPDVEGFSRSGNPSTTTIAAGAGSFGFPVQPGTVIIKVGATVSGFDRPTNNANEGTLVDLTNNPGGTINYSTGAITTSILGADGAEDHRK